MRVWLGNAFIFDSKANRIGAFMGLELAFALCSRRRLKDNRGCHSPRFFDDEAHQKYVSCTRRRPHIRFQRNKGQNLLLVLPNKERSTSQLRNHLGISEMHDSLGR